VAVSWRGKEVGSGWVEAFHEANQALRMQNILTTSKMLNGVFAYLDAVLPEADQAEAAAKDYGVGNGTQECTGYRSRLAKYILHTFRTQFWGSPLKPVLAEYNLYNQDDMSDALAAAYCRHKAGRDPVEALNADYGIKAGGLLSWVDTDNLREDATKVGSEAATIWRHFQPMYRAGDRVVRYSLPTSIGYLLVRGDRRVWEFETLHMAVSGKSTAYEAALKKFKSLGGYPGFFAGKFTWPPADFINPA
jgi:hypothetical protein